MSREVHLGGRSRGMCQANIVHAIIQSRVSRRRVRKVITITRVKISVRWLRHRIVKGAM